MEFLFFVFLEISFTHLNPFFIWNINILITLTAVKHIAYIAVDIT